jgi:rare lipoprotein A
VTAEPEPPLAPEPRATTNKASRVDDQPIATEQGNATWYEVPRRSLAKRRAPEELTAAHDRLPLGSYARVTNLANGRSVVVRITDRGVEESRAIDLCKEAAEKIGLVGKGAAKVQIEALRGRQTLTQPDGH